MGAVHKLPTLTFLRINENARSILVSDYLLY